MVLFCVGMPTGAREISSGAKAAVLMEPLSRSVLFEKQSHQRLPMASTTKIMTALLALESGKTEQLITVTKEMVTVEGTSLGLRAGDQISLYDLACGMLLESGNDAANATAITLGGSISGFAGMMNARAREIGMTDTHFVTPSGLDAPGHFTTAYDMALLACTAMENPAFKEIAAAKTLVVEFGNPRQKRHISNHNRLLSLYDGAIGIKTGFTKKSGRCLVSAAQRDGVVLVAVTLNVGDDWNEHQNLFDYGFSRVQNVNITMSFEEQDTISVVGGIRGSVSLQCPPDIRIPLVDGERNTLVKQVRLPAFVYAPVKAGDSMGSITYYVNGREVFQGEITAQEAVPRLVKKRTGGELFFQILGKSI